MRLLIADDEEDIRTILKYNLSKLDMSIETAKDGIEALDKIKWFKPELLILDIMMGGKDGIDLCREIRSHQIQSFILMLSASSDDYTKIKAYEAGCDDFVNKPININLFVKKVAAIKRRLEQQAPTFAEIPIENKPLQLQIGKLKIDLESYLIYLNDQTYELPKKQFELLVMLAQKPNKVYTRAQIYEHIWGDTIVSERTIDVHITRIRNKLNIDCIKSVKGVGYKIVE